MNKETGENRIPNKVMDEFCRAGSLIVRANTIYILITGLHKVFMNSDVKESAVHLSAGKHCFLGL